MSQPEAWEARTVVSPKKQAWEPNPPAYTTAAIASVEFPPTDSASGITIGRAMAEVPQNDPVAKATPERQTNAAAGSSRWSSQGPSAPITNSARCSRTT